jgi:exopolysaccharide biosynthesis protein
MKINICPYIRVGESDITCIYDQIPYSAYRGARENQIAMAMESQAQAYLCSVMTLGVIKCQSVRSQEERFPSTERYPTKEQHWCATNKKFVLAPELPLAKYIAV